MKSWIRAVAVTGLLALSPALAACGDDNAASGGGGETSSDSGAPAANVRFVSPETRLPTCYREPQADSLTIGWASPIGSNETLGVVGETITAETEKLGGRVIVLDAQGQPDRQVSQIEQLIARDVDAIIALPLDPNALDPVLRKAREANIPTIAIEASQDATDPGLFTSQISSLRDETGYLQAKEATRLLGPGTEYAQIGFAVPVPALEAVIASTRKWGDEFGIRSVGRVDNPSDDIAGGDKAMTELLSRYPDVRGVLAYNDESAVGAAAAARAQGKRDLVIIGTNGGSVGMDAVRSGKTGATVQKQEVDLGLCAVWGAYHAANGERIPPTVATRAPVLITRENVDEIQTIEAQFEERYDRG